MNSQKKFGLEISTIEKINSIFLKHPKVNKVILYGSRAKGNYHQGSDIDLTLIGSTLTTSDLLRMKNDLDDSMLPYKVDLSLFHHIDNPGLIDHIERVGIEFK